jgi:hypothetical protein
MERDMDRDRGGDRDMDRNRDTDKGRERSGTQHSTNMMPSLSHRHANFEIGFLRQSRHCVPMYPPSGANSVHVVVS